MLGTNNLAVIKSARRQLAAAKHRAASLEVLNREFFTVATVKLNPTVSFVIADAMLSENLQIFSASPPVFFQSFLRQSLVCIETMQDVFLAP
jgi:hypothetical protein